MTWCTVTFLPSCIYSLLGSFQRLHIDNIILCALRLRKPKMHSMPRVLCCRRWDMSALFELAWTAYFEILCAWTKHLFCNTTQDQILQAVESMKATLSKRCPRSRFCVYCVCVFHFDLICSGRLYDRPRVPGSGKWKWWITHSQTCERTTFFWCWMNLWRTRPNLQPIFLPICLSRTFRQACLLGTAPGVWT